jgi:hypothetical protein
MPGDRVQTHATFAICYTMLSGEHFRAVDWR